MIKVIRGAIEGTVNQYVSRKKNPEMMDSEFGVIYLREKEVFEIFQSRRAVVYDNLRAELLERRTAYEDLPEEYQVYESFIVSMLASADKGILLESEIDQSDEVYQAWKNDETISLAEYLNHAIAMNWIDVTKVGLDSKYASSEEIYEQLIQTIFEGLDNNTLYKQFQLLSLHGQNKDALAKTQLGAWEYDIIAPFYKCNMTDVMSGIGLAQLKRYPEMLRRRREIIGLYNEGVKGTCIIPLNHYPDNDEGTSSSGHLYICRLEGKTIEERNAIIIKMAERGIACNVHYKPLPMMTAYKALGFDIKDYPNAYEMYHNEITLPLHTRLTDNDVAYVIENFVDIVKSH